MINSISSFSFDNFFLSYGIHKYVIIIAITYVLNNERSHCNLYYIFPVSHLAKVIRSLIVLSFKHQNPLGGLDALSRARADEGNDGL
jgi:hypothetical protein